MKRVQRFALDSIIDVKAYKLGHFGLNIYTVHFKIVAMFRDPTTEPLVIIETAKEDKCIKQVSK